MDCFGSAATTATWLPLEHGCSGCRRDRVVAALTLDLRVTLVGTVPALEDAYYLDITVNDTGLALYFADLLSARVLTLSEPSLEQERHQLVFAATQDTNGADLDDAIQRVVYRTDLPYRPEFSAIARAKELNRRPTTTAAVGRYVSVLAGQQDYIENSALLSAVQVVAAATRLREIRGRAHEAVRFYRAHRSSLRGTKATEPTAPASADDYSKISPTN